MSIKSKLRTPKRPNQKSLTTPPGINFGFIPFKPIGLLRQGQKLTKTNGAFGRQDGKPTKKEPNAGE